MEELLKKGLEEYTNYLETANNYLNRANEIGLRKQGLSSNEIAEANLYASLYLANMRAAENFERGLEKLKMAAKLEI